MDLTNSIANALSGVRLAPSEAEQSAILRALIEKQANRQQQMGYTGGTPAQQAAGLDYLNIPISDRNAQSEAEAVKMSDLATAARRNEGAFTTQKNPLGQVAEKKAQIEAKAFLPTTESLQNSSNPFLMGEQAANAPLLWNPVEGKIVVAGEKRLAGGGKPPDTLGARYDKAIRILRSPGGTLATMANIPDDPTIKASIVDQMEAYGDKLWTPEEKEKAYAHVTSQIKAGLMAARRK